MNKESSSLMWTMNEESSSLMWTQQQSDFEATEKIEQPECTFSQLNTGGRIFEPPPATTLDPTLTAILKQMQLQTEALLAATAKPRQFKKSDQVLDFNPAFTGHKGDELADRWCGPYTMLGQPTPVTYSIDMPERHKKTRSVHVTALNSWQPPVANISYISVVPTNKVEVPDYHHQQSDEAPQFCPQLTPMQFQEIAAVLNSYPEVTTPALGRSRSIQHKIDTGTALPIRLHPYRVPKVWEEPFRNEIVFLQKMGLIEQSTALWEAPMFAIPKKTPGSVTKTPGSVRLVVDYRRLNAVTVPDPYYLPRIEDTLERMARVQFSQLLTSAKVSTRCR